MHNTVVNVTGSKRVHLFWVQHKDKDLTSYQAQVVRKAEACTFIQWISHYHWIAIDSLDRVICSFNNWYIYTVVTRVCTVKPLLSGPLLKQSPSIKRTLFKFPKIGSSIYCKFDLWLSGHSHHLGFPIGSFYCISLHIANYNAIFWHDGSRTKAKLPWPCNYLMFFSYFELPSRFYNNFSQNNQFHCYNTWNSHAYRLPYCRTNIKKFSVFFSKNPSFLMRLITKSSTLKPFLPLRIYVRIN